MTINQEYINETIAQIATVAAKAVVQAILMERVDGDELTGHRGDEASMRPKLGTPSPSYTFMNKVKNIYHTHNLAKAEDIHAVRNSLGRKALIQAEQGEYSKTVKSLQFCKLKRHKSDNLVLLIKRLRIAAKHAVIKNFIGE